MDTGISWSDDGTEWAYVGSDQKRIINAIHRLKEQRPGEVEIMAEPEDNDGCIYAKVPRSWIRIAPPRQVSEDTRARSAEHLRNLRSSQRKTT